MRRVLLIVGVVAVFGVMGVVAAAYIAHDVLTLRHSTTKAGPAWLLFGFGVGAVFGAAAAVALRHLVRLAHPRSGRHVRSS